MFGFREAANSKGLPSDPTIYTTSPSLDEDRTLVWLVVHFACPMIASFPYYCTVSIFDQPSQFVLKNRMFLLSLIENHMQKYGQGGFFRLTYVEPKHQRD